MQTAQVVAERTGLRAVFDDAFFLDICDEINEEFECSHTQEEIKNLIAFLKKRYETFNWVVNYDGAKSEVVDEYVKASRETLVEMIRVCSLIFEIYVYNYNNHSFVLYMFQKDPFVEAYY